MITPAPWLRTETSFPSQLFEISLPPAAVYTLGNRDTLTSPSVAIVGTRNPTSYGERVTAQLTRTLAESGVCIISGMARGIDGIAHRSALAANGRTVAVLGTAIDQPYPQSHTALYNSISQSGLVLSEYAPGSKPFRGCFPRRNRIIAGLADVTVIIEASAKSGALITANYAADYGRTVGAIPGPIDAEQSRGTNQLIRDGANVILDPEDVFVILGLTTPPKKSPALEGDQALVWNAIAPGRDADAITAITGLTASQCSIAVTMLEMQGLVSCALNGELQKR